MRELLELVELLLVSSYATLKCLFFCICFPPWKLVKWQSGILVFPG